MPDDHSLIFVSYSREDSAFALQLTKDLKTSGASVWLDQVDIPTGVRWDTAIEEALSRCTAFLVILSPASVASENVRDEIDFAIGQRKKLIPILHRPCIVPLRINRFQRVDFSKDYQSGLQALSQTLDGLTMSEKREVAIAAPAVPQKQEPAIAPPVKPEKREAIVAAPTVPETRPAAVLPPAKPERREATVAAPVEVEEREAAIVPPVVPLKQEATIAAPAELEKRQAAVVAPAGPWAWTLSRITRLRTLPLPAQILLLATVWQIVFGIFLSRLDDGGVGLSLSNFGLALVLALRFFRPQLRWNLLRPLVFMWLVKAIAELAWASKAFLLLYFALAFVLAAMITGATIASALKQKKLKGAWVGLISFGAPQVLWLMMILQSLHTTPFINFFVAIILECAVGFLFLWFLREKRS